MASVKRPILSCDLENDKTCFMKGSFHCDVAVGQGQMVGRGKFMARGKVVGRKVNIGRSLLFTDEAAIWNMGAFIDISGVSLFCIESHDGS